MSEHHDVAPSGGPDTRPAYTGLILGAIVLFALLYSIVVVTNKHYESETPAAATS
ncbi:MAG TPA: hypothetical protein VFA43_04825 [Gemmatimonadaceae bacterium]|nr:hypothetical protein [Gemmatimonadaceae bacterium]